MEFRNVAAFGLALLLVLASASAVSIDMLAKAGLPFHSDPEGAAAFIESKEQFEIYSYFKGTPAHEVITTMALNRAGVHNPPCEDYLMCQSSVGGNFNFIKGVFWNDDPLGYLWARSCSPAAKSGLFFAADFCACHCRVAHSRVEEWNSARRSNGWNLENYGLGDNLMCRSHFGDLCFIHGQEAAAHIDPVYTRQKMLLWAEFAYLVATGQVPHTSKLSSLQSPSKRVNEGIRNLFNTASYKSKSVADLFFVTSDCNSLKSHVAQKWTEQRAWGSLMHVIQDSFAGGHVMRNSKWEVVMFTAYPLQDGDHHATFDTIPAGPGKDRLTSTYAQGISSMTGAMEAVDRCSEVSKLILNKKPWAVAEKYLVDKVWNFAHNVQKSGAGSANGKSLAVSITAATNTDMCSLAIETAMLTLNQPFSMKNFCTAKTVARKYQGTAKKPPLSLKYDNSLCAVLSKNPSECSKNPNHSGVVSKTYGVRFQSLKVENAESWVKKENVAIFVYVDGEFAEMMYKEMDTAETWHSYHYWRFGTSVRLSVREMDGALGGDELGSLTITAPTSSLTNGYKEFNDRVRFSGWVGDAQYKVNYRMCSQLDKCFPGAVKYEIVQLHAFKAQEGTDHIWFTATSAGKTKVLEQKFYFQTGTKRKNLGVVYSSHPITVKLIEVDTFANDNIGTVTLPSIPRDKGYSVKIAGEGAVYFLYVKVSKFTY